MVTIESERAALLALIQATSGGSGWNEIAARVSAQGSALDVLNESDGALFQSPATQERLDAAEQQVQSWCESGYQLVTILDDSYPRRLRDIREIPPFLFYSGDLRTEDEGCSVVGSRRASDRGKAWTRNIAELLVDEGLTVISGLAEGVDAEAHRAALDAGGRTVAVIGTGIARHYPASNAALQEEIGESGLLLSQFYPGAPPSKKSFPMRNAIMSGYGLATIVVEAGEYSGTRNQARLAGQHGRPVILTDQVVAGTSWGKELEGHPNVYVVASAEGISQALSDIRGSAAQLDGALQALETSA